MPLEGLRAWIGEVERKLGMRTRVFLLLAVIAIGGAGAGIYLAVDARESSVSESDVQELQEQLEAQIGEGGAPTGTAATQLEAEIDALQAEVEALNGKGGGSSPGADGSSSGTGGSSPGGGATGSAGGASPEGTSGSVDKGDLPELLQRAKEASEKAEGK